MAAKYRILLTAVADETRGMQVYRRSRYRNSCLARPVVVDYQEVEVEDRGKLYQPLTANRPHSPPAKTVIRLLLTERG
ncbi:hypothetical protein H6F77_13295 [Microcoleus sp. FACHB-831]|uniref:hypothetical protein n=1 Tax=Microcoleus sp. FACHB-831 TaxID=2692827 RepID=UPI001686045B|nr:hypothetical protein [Microcoleus sp. FACHB-831]MBD1922057.1 hypothetical protein [Microcoleus sp. FACHB-831]